MESPLRDVEDRSVPAAIEANLFSSWRLFGAAPSVLLIDEPGMMRFVGGVAYPLCNHVFRARLPGHDVDGAIDEALGPFRESRVPALWWVGPSSQPADQGARLTMNGLSLTEDVQCYAGDLASLRLDDPPPEGLTIEAVTDEELLDAWLRAFAVGFELPGPVTGFFRACMLAVGLGPGSPMRHYVGLREGEPVACFSLTLADGVAGLYNGATLTEWRGKGVGSALSARGIADALEAGYRVGVAHAMPMGELLCRRLGLEPFFRMQAYLFEG